jgi:hypothetical protein
VKFRIIAGKADRAKVCRIGKKRKIPSKSVLISYQENAKEKTTVSDAGMGPPEDSHWHEVWYFVPIIKT